MYSTPRRLVAVLATSAVALSIGLATTASSSAPEPGPSGADSQKAYAAAAKKSDYVKLDLLAINDFHGQLEVVPSTSSSGRINTTPAGGAAYLAALLNAERKKSRAAGAKTVTVAAGDLIGASPLLSAAFHDEPTIEAMNKLRLDVAAVGNHEFDEGWREIKRLQNGGCLPDGPNGAGGANSCPGDKTFEGAKFKYLGANVVWKNPADHKKKKTVFPATKIVKVQGQKVAFIGMTLEDTDTIVSQAGIADIDFADEVETANALVPKLRKKGVKSIVVLLHEGVTPTDATAYNDCTVVTGAALDIAKNLSPAIDAVVSGHTHQPYNCVVKDPAGQPRLLTSASSLGRMVSKLHFLIDPKTHDIVRPAAFAENIIVGNSEGQKQSKKINSIISAYNTLVLPIANAIIGHIATGTSITRTTDANGADSPLGNLIADSQKADATIVRNGVKPVIALMNPGGIRADLLENAAGDVTYGAAFNVQPFNNTVVSMDLTGAQIKALLNEQWNGINEAGQRKILQVSGLSYTWDLSDAAAVTPNALVGDVLVDDDGNSVTPMVPLVDGTTYRVVANGFLSDGGDNFATFKAGTNKLIGGLDIDSLRTFLAANDPTSATPTDRISQQP